jgi:hypothetical protein
MALSKSQKAQRYWQHGDSQPTKRPKYQSEPWRNQSSDEPSDSSLSSLTSSDCISPSKSNNSNNDSESSVPHTPQKVVKTTCQITAINRKWEILKDAIKEAETYYDDYETSNSKAIQQFNELSELRDFNYIRREMELARKGTASMDASIATVKSSLRRQRTPLTGYEVGKSHTERLRKQALHIITYKRLPIQGNGLTTNHFLILDNKEVSRAIFEWISTHKVGKVIHSLHSESCHL